MKYGVLCKTVVAALAVLAAVPAVPARPADWKAPELDPFTQPVSKARWLWFQAPKTASFTTAYYRMNIDLDEPVKSAWIICIFDDNGGAALNDRMLKEVKMVQPDAPIPCRRYEPTNWVVGRNSFSFTARNGEAMGGMILRGEITLQSGKVIKLYSNKDSFKASAKAEGKWRTNSYDDSQWQPAMELGDANIEPWKSVTAVMNFLLDEEDQKKYDELMKRITDISFLKDQEEWKAQVVWNNDASGIAINGEPDVPMVFLVGGNPWKEQVAHDVVQAGLNGVKFMEYQFPSGKYIIGPGQYDFSPIDRDIRRILVLNPDAALFVAMRFDLLGKWARENPEEMIGYAMTSEKHWGGQNGNFPSPSMASEKFQAEMQAFGRAAIEHMKKQDYYKRIVAIRTSHGIFSEWHYYGMGGIMPDNGPAMTKAFRKYLTGKYKTDEALQRAWFDSNVTLATATVPNEAERWGKKRFFRDPASADRKTLDYYECHENVVADTLLGFAKSVKSVDPRLMVGAYYGYFFCMGYPAEGQTLMMDKVLSSPYIDFLSSPYSYDMASRQMGGDGLPRMLLSSFKRYKKLAIIEADERTHLTPRHEPYLSAATPEESVAIIRRETAIAWLNGCAVQFLEFDARRGMKGWFDHPDIYRTWGEGQKMWRKIYADAASVKRDAVVVFSPEEMTRQGYPSGSIRQGTDQRGIIETVIDKPMHALFASGYTFDVLTLSDYLASSHEYKFVAFMNIFSPTAEQRKAIKDKISKPGTTVVWSYAPGFVTEQGLSVQAMEDLTGFKLGVINERLPMSVTLDGGVAMTSVRRNNVVKENPRVFAKDPAAEVIGKYAQGGQTAVAIKKLANGNTAIFCGMPVIDPDIWAAFFQRGGIHRYVNDRNVSVHGNERYLLVHVATGGAYEVKLPRQAKQVKELFSGDVLGRNCSKLILRPATGFTYFMEITY
ncbi:MAG: hypothetical protein E7047_09830 [Lentisphaerae bacterium]|nr:hypothetical protein [Lentisphaerota bacterium]